MRTTGVKRSLLEVAAVLAALQVLPTGKARACSCAVRTGPSPVEAAGDNAWLVPLVGGSALAVLLGVALLVVLLLGRRR